jgi:hypothetical protein
VFSTLFLDDNSHNNVTEIWEFWAEIFIRLQLINSF